MLTLACHKIQLSGHKDIYLPIHSPAQLKDINPIQLNYSFGQSEIFFKNRKVDLGESLYTDI